MHAAYNASKVPFNVLNDGFSAQVSAAASTLSNQWVVLFLDDAMSLITDGQDFFFDGRGVQGKKDYAETELYNKLILAIHKQAASGEGVTIRQAMEEMRHDWSKGAPQVNPCH